MARLCALSFSNTREGKFERSNKIKIFPFFFFFLISKKSSFFLFLFPSFDLYFQLLSPTESHFKKAQFN